MCVCVYVCTVFDALTSVMFTNEDAATTHSGNYADVQCLIVFISKTQLATGMFFKFVICVLSHGIHQYFRKQYHVSYFQ